VVARVAAVGLVAGSIVGLAAVSAGADAPNPGNTQTGTAVQNPDGTITVTVTGSWQWGNKECDKLVNVDTPSPKDYTGWQVSWGDNTVNQLGSTGIYVGGTGDNTVAIPTTSCTNDGSGGSSGTFDQTLSHTYAAGTSLADIEACVVTYHVSSDSLDGTGKHSLVAGGANNNSDNSVQENEETPADGCVPVTISSPPDVAIVKTGPTTVTSGTNFNYTLTASNTGLVTAPGVVVTDVIPSNLTYVSATPAVGTCSFDSGTKTLSCDVGDLAVGATTTVTVTVTPTVAGTDIVNQACVAPGQPQQPELTAAEVDPTPADNCSTFTILGANVLGDVVVAAQPVTVAPAFTG
jgi:uncharacterized repeat protein (TIGR01451 family)